MSLRNQPPPFPPVQMCSEDEARKALEVVRKYQETRTREKLQEQLRRKGAEAAGIGQDDIEALVADTVKSRLTAAVSGWEGEGRDRGEWSREGRERGRRLQA